MLYSDDQCHANTEKLYSKQCLTTLGSITGHELRQRIIEMYNSIKNLNHASD